MKKIAGLLMLVNIFFSCAKKAQFEENFDKYNNRVWVNENFWPIPLEEWKIQDGKVECIGEIANMRLNLLTQLIKGPGNFSFSIDMGVTNTYTENSSSGIRIAVQDSVDSDVKSLCYFGEGIEIGINTEGYLFIDDTTANLPEGFDYSDFNLDISGLSDESGNTVTAICTDNKGKSIELKKDGFASLDGMISLVQNFAIDGYFTKHPKYYFDNISLSGSNVVAANENSNGPILFTMYTLSKGTLNLTAQFPPLSEADNKVAELHVSRDGVWETLATTTIEDAACIAPFRIENWDSKQELPYRVVYKETFNDGSSIEHFYDGLIRYEPVGKDLSVGGLTCQFASGFPYTPLVNNLEKSNPDLLFFSGDQVYEWNGNYGIIRFPAERAILNYLGKWYMFGWAFKDVMKNRPTICIPDDHEVFQGNLWGAGGKTISQEIWNKSSDCVSGFVEPIEMVNVVMRTNCSHLPAPYDPTPMENGILVYYTEMEYAEVSFAIVGDRIFKSGPENVATWEGRLDHIKKPLKDPSILHKEGLQLLGKRQMDFLNHWANNWDGKQIKVLLSQTLFANTSTHHGGNRMFLHGDMDSGGWPKKPRDKTVVLIDKCKAFHICGDQHLTSMVQYGVNNYRDAGWVFCTPAISVGYARRFHPDKLGWKVSNRPAHNLPNTGEYKDGFGNKNYVYLVGNPDNRDEHPNRYTKAELKASGYGMIYFDKAARTVKCESIRFLVDVDKIEEAQFPGWPVTINLDTKEIVE